MSMERPRYHLYFTNVHCHESCAVNICNTESLSDINTAVWHIIEAHLTDYTGAYWNVPGYSVKKAEEITNECRRMLDADAVVEKRKFPFWNIGFIITNYPMWPNNKGGYENDFCF